ncbi:hypothetical protein EYF80_040324 [Liparis tanakae]|uniref:Uncharacterized protein n=1 Tax=Liparis tanakae TaxID=230148 RepID=A0A4Z2G959_9TELE|nr:hypothetical protein EYF80_040324 [Liparis tanakae]
MGVERQHGGYFDTHLNNVELECGATLTAQLFPDRLSHSDFRQLLQRQENGKGSGSVVEKVDAVRKNHVPHIAATDDEILDHSIQTKAIMICIQANAIICIQTKAIV